MAQQTSGWAGTPNAAGITVQDAFQRNLLMKYGGRTDNIWDYHDFEGYKKEMGSVLRAPGSQYASSFRNSGMAPSFGGRNTPSDPGSYNWDTLNKGLNRAAGIGWGLVDWRMKDKRMAADKAKNSNYVTTYQQQANKALGHMAPNYSSWYQQQATSQTSGNSQATQQRRPGRRSPYSGPQPPAPPVP